MRAWALLLALAATPVCAQELPVRLADGATWTLTAQRDRERLRQGAAPQKSQMTSTARLSWKPSAAGGELTVVNEAAKATGQGQEVDLHSMFGVPVVLDVDEAVAPAAIRNWTEIRAQMDRRIDAVVPDPAGKAAAKGMFAAMPAEQAAQVLAPELVLASVAQGTALTLGEEVPYEDQLPNPLGGPPIKAVGRFKLVSYDAAAGRAVVTWSSAFDPVSTSESLRAAMENLVGRLAPDRAEEARKFFAEAKVDRKDACRHEIDIPTGLAVKADCSSTILITAKGETASSVDRWTITQTLPKTKS